MKNTYAETFNAPDFSFNVGYGRHVTLQFFSESRMKFSIRFRYSSPFEPKTLWPAPGKLATSLVAPLNRSSSSLGPQASRLHGRYRRRPFVAIRLSPNRWQARRLRSQ